MSFAGLAKNDCITLSASGKTQIRRERGSRYGVVMVRPTHPLIAVRWEGTRTNAYVHANHLAKVARIVRLDMEVK